MSKTSNEHAAERWAAFRFAVVGGLLASPPGRGQLRAALDELAQRTWEHPTTGEAVRFSATTLERWLYVARGNPRNPVTALRRRVRKDAGQQPSMNERLRTVLSVQHRDHPSWSAKLHYDNLAARVQEDPTLGPLPSVGTVRRYMRAHGLVRKRPPSRRKTPGTEKAARRLERREVRSYEVTHVGGLWHSDFHPGSRKVLLPTAVWQTPHLFGVLDDRARLCAHLQWYLDETAESYAHGLMQAFQKRGLCRELLDDNGAAMTAAEVEQALLDLGILHSHTLPDSPYQNGKQEAFWGTVEKRLMPMLDDVRYLTLELLNEATQAWVELDYNRHVHSELGVTPLERFLEGPDVLRECPQSEPLRLCFRQKARRSQRKSDGTVSIEGQRFEVPSRFRLLRHVFVRYARWDLSRVDMVDPRHGTCVARLYPQDKHKNADGKRRLLEPVASTPFVPAPTGEVAPLLRQLMSEYAQSGLPPAYLPTKPMNITDKKDPSS